MACVAAYEPICAVSLADSYINRANPGMYDAAPGVAPTWAESTGWTFNGSTQYLTSGYTPGGGGSVAIRFGSMTNNASLFGAQGALCYIFVYRSKALGMQYANCDAGSTYQLPATDNGVFVLAGRTAYRDGSVDKALGAVVTIANPILIGARGNLAGSAMEFSAASIQALYIYNVTLTPTQVRAVTDAMNMLPMRPRVPAFPSWVRGAALTQFRKLLGLRTGSRGVSE